MSLFLQLSIQIYADEMRSKTGLKITLGVGGTVEDINETGCCGLVNCLWVPGGYYTTALSTFTCLIFFTTKIISFPFSKSFNGSLPSG